MVRWDVMTVVFTMGIILSFVVGMLFEDSGAAVAAAVCFIGAMLVAKEWK